MYSILMAIVDFIPVILFGMACILLQKNLYSKMSKEQYCFFCTGTIDIFLAGLLKATHKLLYALNICDFKPFYDIFFPLQSIGFIMCGITIVCMLILNKGKKKMYSIVAAPVVFEGTMIFVTFMILGTICLEGSVAVLAKRMKNKSAFILLIIACIIALVMGYLSSKDFSEPLFNWIGEITNIIGQLCFLIGVKKLDKAGLKDFEIV